MNRNLLESVEADSGRRPFVDGWPNVVKPPVLYFHAFAVAVYEDVGTQTFVIALRYRFHDGLLPRYQ